MKTLPTEHSLEAHLMRLETQGYTIVPGAIPKTLLDPIRHRFDELVERHIEVPTAVCDDEGIVNLNRLYELDPAFEDLMDLPSVFTIAKAAMNDDITLLGGAIGHYLPAHTPSRMGWHSDGDYLRFTYFISDVEESGGGTALVPGSHHGDGKVPAWFHDSENQPHEVPGMVVIQAKAGACMINNTRLWHTRSPNRTDQPRRVIWQVFKRADQEPTSNMELRLSQEYIDTQTNPQRRKLMGLPTTTNETPPAG